MVGTQSLLAAAALVGGGAEATAAVAQDYLGTWRIANAQTAPWADHSEPQEVAEGKDLVGRKVVYRRNRIDGPEPLACKAPVYKLIRVPAEGLFQGGLTAPK